VERLRVGLLGCGGIGARHAAAVGALEDEMQLVACSGRNEAKVREFAARFGAEPFTDLHRMLDSQIDLLIVALPPFAHSGQVEQAVAAGTRSRWSTLQQRLASLRRAASCTASGRQ
jgi:predicted dehydrogenase